MFKKRIQKHAHFHDTERVMTPTAAAIMASLTRQKSKEAYKKAWEVLITILKGSTTVSEDQDEHSDHLIKRRTKSVSSHLKENNKNKASSLRMIYLRVDICHQH